MEKNVFCYGKYENPKYFNEIRSIILKEFTPCMPPLESNKQLYSIIETTNSVCVSIDVATFLAIDLRIDFWFVIRTIFSMQWMKRKNAFLIQPLYFFLMI